MRSPGGFTLHLLWLCHTSHQLQRLKPNRPHQHSNPTAKLSWEKLMNPPPFLNHPLVSKLQKPLLFSWTVKEGTSCPPDSSFPVFAPLNPLHWPLLRGHSAEPHPAFCRHLPSFAFPQPWGFATGPQSKWSPNAYDLRGACRELQSFKGQHGPLSDRERQWAVPYSERHYTSCPCHFLDKHANSVQMHTRCSP